jgi:hypothetical protein
MPTTTPLAFPYPAASDAVKNGAAAIQALAEAADDAIAGANVTYTIGANVSGTVSPLRRGQMMFVNITLTTGAALSAGHTLFTLPVGARPPSLGVDVFGTLVNGTTEANVRTHVLSSGAVNIQVAVASGVTLRGSLVFPL